MNNVHSDNSTQNHTCNTCKRSYSSRTTLRRHVCRGLNGNGPRTLIRVGAFEDETLQFPGDASHSLGRVLHRAWDSIRSGLRSQRFVDILNCRLYRTDGDSTPETPWDALERVWDRLECGVKLNCSVGCILRHNTSGSFRYYHSSSNNATLFPVAKTIMRKTELEQAFREYDSLDVREDASQRRPNTSWNLVAITNVTFYIYKLLDSSKIGANVELPEHIRNNRFVHSMVKCKKTGRSFDDNTAQNQSESLSIHTLS